MNISIDECRKIAELTYKQASSREWFQYRAGRITASRFKSVCRTKIEKPSMSVVKAICCPLSSRFSTATTIYGCKHEKVALEMYKSHMLLTHENFEVSEVGLIINPQYPYFGASPDGGCSCDCCGLGSIEIKCPLCVKDLTFNELSKKIGTAADSEGTMHLKQDHQYYYQIQMQMAVTATE